MTDSERRALEARLQVLSSQLDAEYGKRSLERGDIAGAQMRFARAAEGHSGWKLHAVGWGLRIAPALTRRAFLFKARRQASIFTAAAPSRA